MGDVRCVVLRSFQNLFFYMESFNVMTKCTCLHCTLFIFEEFVVLWNNHSIRTTGGLSPRQLYINGILDVHNCNYSAVQNIYDADQGNPMFGVDDSDEL